MVQVDEPLLHAVAQPGQKVALGGLELEGGQSISLEVEPLRVVGPETRIVIGRKGGVDEPFSFDTSSVQLFHGTVQGNPQSNVVVISSPRGVRAHIDLGQPNKRYTLTTVASDSLVAGRQFAEIRPVTQGDRLPDVPMCGRDSVSLAAESGSVAGCCFEPDPGEVHNKRLAVTEIALETDYDLYANFNDPTVTTDYLIELIARTNAIFMRDVDTRFEIVFIRLFDNPNDEPSFMNDPDPLNGYVNYWFDFMSGVARDTGAFLTGRRDLPYGGIAYIGAVCTDFAYCVCGYLNGFPDPTRPNTGDYDLGVVAHELGHNFNACHTPDYCPQVDQCYPPPVVPQRGTMMSYCSQSVSGGNLVTELWYHTRLRRVMRNFVEFNAFCLSYDCDQNGVDDAIDISAPGADVNGNGVLDRCEDCNANGILDPADISSLTSADLNGNGIPDECEPDCNHNNVPDDREILLQPSLDVWGNGIPDECESDCDQNGFMDYNQIQVNLSLDIDRNAVLDACQDCDGNGINDLVELNGARNAWVASDVLNFIGEYHAISGVRVKISTTGALSAPQDVVVGPGGNKVFVSSANTNKIVHFNAHTGTLLGDFVPAGSGGLNYPTGIIFGPNGNLFVSSRNTNSVLQYDGATGAFINAFVPAGSGGLISPFGLIFGPNGNLFVTCGGVEVLEYDGSTGAFVRKFVTAADNGGLSGARGIVFKPDGNLLVASYNTDALLQYNGTTGAFINKWNSGGTLSALYLDGPWGLRLGPNGNIYATRDLPAILGEGSHDDDHGDWDAGAAELTAPLHVTSARIMEFDITNGQYLESYILGDDTGLRSPTGFDFMPGTADCNFNMMPDNCDMANCGGNPACGDCNSNGIMDSCDIAACNGVTACGDCNHNGVPDGCDISAATSVDIDPANGIPDECEFVAIPSTPSADPSGQSKTRFISFSVPASAVAGGLETALRVQLVSLHHVVPPYAGGATIPFTSFEGQVRWVGPPVLYTESASIAVPFYASALQCTPHYRDWSTVGLLHVTGSAIVPSSQYQVENLAASCAGIEASCAAVSPRLSVATTRWGDIEIPYNPPDPTTQPDLGDIAALVNKFKSQPGAPIKARALLVGDDAFGNISNSTLSLDIGFGQIAACVDAFKGNPYPHTIQACP